MIGIDEVGRGAWAGPLLVCAARINSPILGLADSKALSAKRRELLAAELLVHADIGYGWVSAEEIDAIGLSAALKFGAMRAIQELGPQENEDIIIDGTINLLPGYANVITKIKADATVPCVSAASIVAKVARDAHMRTLSDMYPEYNFEQHVGYGTAKHAQVINDTGLCIEHRKSFKLPVKV